MESKPGTGAVSPFGDGKGATSAAGAASGAHDFLKDPQSAAPKSGGRDFSKENRDQQSGTDDTINDESVPDGGTILKADPPAGSQRVSPVGLPTGGKTPFTLRSK